MSFTSQYNSMIRADIVACDVSDFPVLLVEVKGVSPVPESISQLISYLETVEPKVPFGMLVDPDKLQVFRREGDTPSKPVLVLSTQEVLRHYDPEFGPNRSFETYLEALVEAWLRDLAVHWNSDNPPAVEQIAAIGLLKRLQGGMIWREVPLERSALH